jgi:hypothetical protein
MVIAPVLLAAMEMKLLSALVMTLPITLGREKLAAAVYM